ncbi:MAG: type IV pilus assembly protein PilM, partial [Verrucomicrobiae bacterium]|nr:type IV pilus assembly protein PilM [Verrucomicrobiae bacterium]
VNVPVGVQLSKGPLLVATLRNLLKERGIRRGKTVFSISGQSVFTRFVKLPPVDEAKVAQIILYEAQQNVPFPIQEVVWDYQLIGTNAQGELEVVLFAIKGNIIEELNRDVESVGLETVLVDVAPMALYNAYRYNYGEMEGCTMILDIGARTTNLLFAEQNKIFSRSLPIAGNAITQNIASEFNIKFLDAETLKKRVGFVALGGAYEEPEDQTQARVSKIIRNVMTRLHAEVARSVNFYRTQQGGSPPARVLLAGGTSVIPYTDRFFHEKFQVPVEYLNPFRNLQIEDKISREELGKVAHFFGEVVGLGLRQLGECPIEVNLMPVSLKQRRSVEEKRPYLAGAALCILVVPMAVWAYQAKVAKIRQERLNDVRALANQYDRTRKEIEAEKAALEEVLSKTDRMAQLVEQRTYWLAVLDDVSQRVTRIPDLWITSISPVQAGGAEAAPTPVGRGRRGVMAAPTEPAASSTAPKSAGVYLQIRGEGIHSVNNPAQDLELVEQFAEELRQSPFFDKDDVEIVEPPPAMTEKEIFQFGLRARLKTLPPT